MNVQEFAALKVGDRIHNPMGNSTGEIVSTDATGVRVRWLGAGRDLGNIEAKDYPSAAPTWHYSVQSTAWFHWSTADEADEVGASA